MAKTQREIVRQGYQVLVDALGVADALRFIQHFSNGQGDYTQSRQTQLEETPLKDILSDMSQLRSCTIVSKGCVEGQNLKKRA